MPAPSGAITGRLMYGRTSGQSEINAKMISQMSRNTMMRGKDTALRKEMPKSVCDPS
jgi:hypothetical protein